MEKSNASSGLDTATLTPIPSGEKKSWVTVAMIQVGSLVCVPSLMLGGLLAEGMSMTNTIIAGTIGYIVGITLVAVMGIQGSDLGLPGVVCAQSAFGKIGGRIIISAILAFTLIGWFGIQTDVCGAAFSTLMNSAFGINIPGWVSALFWGIIMLLTAFYGINALGILNYVAVPALLVFSFYGAYKAVVFNGGMENVFNYTPEVPMTLSEGIALSMAYNIFVAVIAADYTRFLRTRGDTMKSSYIGMVVPGVVLLVLGAIMSRVAGSYDIVSVLGDIGAPILGAIILILATWTTNVMNVYSAGIDAVALFDLDGSKRAIATLICGAIGIILSIVGIMGYFEPILNWMGYLFTPLVGIMLADYFVLHKGKAEGWKISEGISWVALAVWAVGTVVCILVPSGFASMIGGLAAFLVYILVAKIFPNKTQ